MCTVHNDPLNTKTLEQHDNLLHWPEYSGGAGDVINDGYGHARILQAGLPEPVQDILLGLQGKLHVDLNNLEAKPVSQVLSHKTCGVVSERGYHNLDLVRMSLGLNYGSLRSSDCRVQTSGHVADKHLLRENMH